MNVTIRSIDSLLNRFDELSQCHASLLTDFDAKLSEIKNPLRNIVRTEDVQRPSIVNENDDRFGITGPLEHFHRHVLRSRFLHRPPTYSSNDNVFSSAVVSKSSFTSGEPISFPKIATTTKKEIPSQPVVLTSRTRIVQTKNEPKTSSRRHARSTVTVFTMETVNRLSKPKRYNRLPEQKTPVKCTQQPPKPVVTKKKEISKDSSTKRTKTSNNKSSSKKSNGEKENPVHHSSSPLAPSKRPNLPSQSKQKSSRIVNLPKITPRTKRSLTQPKS